MNLQASVNGAYPESICTDGRVCLNSLASDLCNIADDDYIDARTLYRNERYKGFIYHATQAVEKYLKCILLNLEAEVPYKHDLEILYNQAVKKSRLDLTERSILFLKEIDGLGVCVRYDHKPYCIRLELLHELDYFVRDIRPWCKGRCVPDHLFFSGKEEGFLNLKSGHKFPTPNIMINGKLERLLKSKSIRDKKSRANLIWNNPFFYSVKRKYVKRITGSYSRNLSSYVL